MPGKLKKALCIAAFFAASGTLTGIFYSSPAFLHKVMVVSAVINSPDGAVGYLSDLLLSKASASGISLPEPSAPEDPSPDEPAETSAPEAPETSAESSVPLTEKTDEPSEKTLVPASSIPSSRLGKITAKQISVGDGGVFVDFGGGTVKNSSGYTREQILAAINAPFSSGYDSSGKAQILVYHTHATECYSPYEEGSYDTDFSFRSKDDSENTVAVGNVFCDALAEKGIASVHSAMQHDNPQYTGAYTRSAETVRSALAENPSLYFLLDIHRDALETSDGDILKPVVTVNGKQVAQIMLICCSGNDHAFENLRFAAALQRALESLAPGITRPTMFCDRKYNQELSPRALLIEIGTHGNSLAEAKASARILADALEKVFSEYPLA